MTPNDDNEDAERDADHIEDVMRFCARLGLAALIGMGILAIAASTGCTAAADLAWKIDRDAAHSAVSAP